MQQRLTRAQAQATFVELTVSPSIEDRLRSTQASSAALVLRDRDNPDARGAVVAFSENPDVDVEAFQAFDARVDRDARQWLSDPGVSARYERPCGYDDAYQILWHRYGGDPVNGPLTPMVLLPPVWNPIDAARIFGLPPVGTRSEKVAARFRRRGSEIDLEIVAAETWPSEVEVEFALSVAGAAACRNALVTERLIPVATQVFASQPSLASAQVIVELRPMVVIRLAFSTEFFPSDAPAVATIERLFRLLPRDEPAWMGFTPDLLGEFTVAGLIFRRGADAELFFEVTQAQGWPTGPPDLEIDLFGREAMPHRGLDGLRLLPR